MGRESARSLVMASVGLAPLGRGWDSACPPPRLYARTRSGSAPTVMLGKAGSLPAGTDSNVERFCLKTWWCRSPCCCSGPSALGRQVGTHRSFPRAPALGHAVGARTVSLGVLAQGSRFPNGIVGHGEVVVEVSGVTQQLSTCPFRPIPSVPSSGLCLPSRACSSASACGGAWSL